MGKFMRLYHGTQGDFMIIGRTDNEVILQTYNYKVGKFKYNLRKRIEFTEKKDGIHFSLFSDDVIIPLSEFNLYTKLKPVKNDYFK